MSLSKETENQDVLLPEGYSVKIFKKKQLVLRKNEM